MSLINSVFDSAFEPFADRPPLLSLALLAAASALLLLLSYRLFSNRRAIRRAKNLFQVHLLEARLFQDQFRVVWSAWGKLLRATLAYLGWSLVPLAFAALPIALLIAQMEMRYGSRPLLPGESALLIVRVDEPGALDRISLQLPEGVAETAPLVRIPAERRVVARLETRLLRRSRILVSDGAEQASKEIVTGVGLERISRERLRGRWFARLFEPGEEALPDSGPITSITLEYPARRMTIGPFALSWLVVYFVLTLSVAFALRRILGAEC